MVTTASLARKLEVKRRQSDCERLEKRARESYVHVEHLFAHAAKLHVDVVVVVLVNQLEVFNGRLVDAAVEVEHERLHLFIPLGRLVEEKHYIFIVVLLELLLDRHVRLQSQDPHLRQSFSTCAARRARRRSEATPSFAEDPSTPARSSRTAPRPAAT